MTEAGIVTRAKQGDIKAFDELFERYKNFVWSVAYRMTYNFDAAEDIAQDVFIAVWKGLRSFSGKSAFSTWLYRITVNKTLNWFRARPKSTLETQSATEPRSMLNQQSTTDPEAALQAREAERELGAILSRLEPERRVVVILREIEGLSYQEIAEATGAPIGTVRSRIARARTDLEAIVEKIKK